MEFKPHGWISLSFWAKFSFLYAKDFSNKWLAYIFRAISLLQFLSLIVNNVPLGTSYFSHISPESMRDNVGLFALGDIAETSSTALFVLIMIMLYLFFLTWMLVVHASLIFFKAYKPIYTTFPSKLLILHMEVIYYPITLFLSQLLFSVSYNQNYTFVLSKGSSICIAATLLCINFFIALHKAIFCYSSIKNKTFSCRKNSFNIVCSIILKLALSLLQALILKSDDQIDEVERKVMELIAVIISLIISVAVLLNTYLNLPEYKPHLLKQQIIHDIFAVGITFGQLFCIFFTDKAIVFGAFLTISPLWIIFMLNMFNKRIQKLIFVGESSHKTVSEINHIEIIFKELNKNLILPPLNKKFSLPNLGAKWSMYKMLGVPALAHTTNEQEAKRFKEASQDFLKECYERLLKRTKNNIPLLLAYIRLITKHFKMYPKAFHLCLRLKGLKLKTPDRIALYVVMENMYCSMEQILLQTSSNKTMSHNIWQKVKFSQAFDVFRNQLHKYNELSIKFWEGLNVERPDMYQLFLIAQKIRNQELSIQKTWDKEMSQFLLTRPSICLIYGIFKKLFLNLPAEGKAYLDKYKTLNDNKMAIKAIPRALGGSSATIIVSGERTQLGNILGCSKSVSKIFGADKSYFIGKNVKTIMPEYFQEKHDLFIVRFYETGKSVIMDKERKLYAKGSNNNIFPVSLCVSMYLDPQKGIVYTSLVKVLADSNEYMVVRQDETIDEVSLGIQKILNIKPSNKMKLFDICPELDKLRSIIANKYNYSNLRTKDSSLIGLKSIHERSGEEQENYVEFRPYLIEEDNENRYAEPLHFSVKSQTFTYEGEPMFVLIIKPLHMLYNNSRFEEESSPRKIRSTRFNSRLAIEKPLKTESENELVPIKKLMTLGDTSNRITFRTSRQKEENPTGLFAKGIGSNTSTDRESQKENLVFNLKTQSTKSFEIWTIDNLQTGYTTGKRHPDKMRKVLVLTYMILIISTLAISLTEHLMFNQSVNDTRFMVDVIKTSSDRLDALLWVWRFVLVYQTRVINLYPTVMVDMDRYKLVVSTYREVMKNANNQLMEIVSSSNKKKDFLFEKNVKILLTDASEALNVLYLNNFDAINSLTEKASIFLSKSHATLFTGKNPEIQFILKNSVNDLLLVSENTVKFFEDDFFDMIDTKKSSLSIMMILNLTLIVLLVIIVVYNLIMAHEKNRELFQSLITINQKKIEAIISQFVAFDKSLFENQRKAMANKLSKMCSLAQSQDLSQVKKKQTLRHYRASDVLIMKLKQVLFLLVCVACFSGLYFYRSVSSNNLLDRLVLTYRRLAVATRARYDYNLVVGTVMDLIAYQNTTYMRNEPIDQQAIKNLQRISSNQYLVDMYTDTHTGTFIDPLIETMFKTKFCSFIPEFPGGKTQTNCIKSTKNETMGLFAVNLDYYADLEYYTTEIRKNLSYSSAKNLFSGITSNTTPKFYATVGAFTFLTMLMSQKFQDQVGEFLGAEQYGFNWHITLMLMFTILSFWVLFKKVTDDEVTRMFLRTIPYKESINNKKIKRVVIRLYKDQVSQLNKINELL